MAGWKHFMKNNGMHISWLIALVATVGSLYFSEVMHYLPCKLCWYQRILMYPLVIILGIASVKKDYKQTIYVLPMAIWGAGISIYHILMQKTTWFQEAANSCGPVPCDVDYINWLGFITIPVLAGTAFLLIAIVQFLTWRATRSSY
ncbi:disulfide oxidoreductase [Paenibacillus eucommiae]|uniref:Disulfide bond formation protein DsbB n=1 Tax=Paenibacillus eucommiae TaxID=1355755 RepID=A0ABS4IQP4_9BACL|nr:disulfide oxidoreductase [Paenibacillus eucommiae]MBP1989311.1 disulfide bond formation protein DsbB [Paenibacillus eucommiae]